MVGRVRKLVIAYITVVPCLRGRKRSSEAWDARYKFKNMRARGKKSEGGGKKSEGGGKKFRYTSFPWDYWVTLL